MKTIIKVLLFILTMVLLCQCEKESPEVTIPDDKFLNALIELGVDTNGDGIISPAEAEVITSLDVSEYHWIADMTGIEAFVNLDTLYYEYNITVYVEKSVELENNIIIWSNCKDRYMSNDKNEYILKSDSTFNIDISLIQIDIPRGSGRFYPNDSIYWARSFLWGDVVRLFYGSKE